MKKPHVLFVTEKYADANPAWLSNSHHNLFGSLECSSLATYSNFFLEENLQYLDDKLITYHRRLAPDLVVVTILPTKGFNSNPTDKALSTIRGKTPIAFIWFDAVHKEIMDRARHMERYAALNLILD